MLERRIEHLLNRPVGRPPRKPIIRYHDFSYQSGCWDQPRREVAKVEWHRGELLPRVDFMVSTMTARSEAVVHFYNRQGAAPKAESWR